MKKLIGILFLTLIVNFAFADGYWLEIKGSGKIGDTLFIKIRYGGVDENKNRYIKSGKDLDKMKDFILSVSQTKKQISNISIRQYKDYWEGYFIPKEKGTYRIEAIDSSLPVVERTDTLQNIKPIQYLRATYQVGNKKATIKSSQFLDIIVDTSKSLATIQPFIDGTKVKKGTELRVFFPDNHDETLKVNSNNQMILKLQQKGLYLLRLDWVDKTSGNFGEKKYFSIRHRCDYALENL